MQKSIGNRRRTTSTLLAALLGGILTLSAASQLKASVFSYDPIPEQDIVSATFTADFAGLVAHRTVLGEEVNRLRLVDLTSGLPNLDLSDAFFGTAAWPAPPQINMGDLQTGFVSVAIPASFFPALAGGNINMSTVFTDTDDALFAIDFLSLSIDTVARGTIVSQFGPNSGFGLGIADEGDLPSAMPGVLPPTGTGFAEEISSIFLIPEPTSLMLLTAGALLLLGRRRGERRLIVCKKPSPRTLEAR